MSTKFTEEKLEIAIIELLQIEGYKHVFGQNIVREPNEVLIREDIKAYLSRRYAADNITSREIESIIRKLEVFSVSDLYESNKAIMKMVSDGFLLKREDRSKKDLYIQLIDYGDLTELREPKSIEVETVVAEEVAPYNATQNIYNDYPPVDRDEVYKEIFEQAENFKRNSSSVASF